MRIAFDAKRIFHNPTGLGNYARSLVRGLVQHFPLDQYQLYTPGIKLFIDFMLQEKQVKRMVPHGTLAQLVPSMWRGRWLVKQLQKEQVDIYHGLSNELPKGIENTGIHSVVTIHDLIFIHYPETYPLIDRLIYRRKFKSAVMRADKIIAASHQTANDIIKAYRTHPAKIEVVYQDCDMAYRHVYTAQDKADVMQRYKITQPFIFCVGTIEKRKNQVGLLKAFARARLEDMQLVFLGREGDAWKELIAAMGSTGTHHRVKIISKADPRDLPVLYQCAHVFAYPSYYEGFGIPVLEAMRSRVPVLTSNTSSLPEVAGNAALLVDPADTHEMALALERLCIDKDLRNELLDHASAQLKRFEPKALATQLMRVYENLLL